MHEWDETRCWRRIRILAIREASEGGGMQERLAVGVTERARRWMAGCFWSRPLLEGCWKKYTKARTASSYSGSVHRPFGAAWMVGLGKSVADKYQVDDRCLNIFDHV